MLRSFINFLNYEKRYSVHTVSSYTNDIGQFFHFTLSRFELEDPALITHYHIRSWVVEMMEGGISPRSVNRKLSALKTYYGFLKKQGTVNHNPTTKVVSPKVESRLPNYVQEKELETLFEDLVFPENFQGVRDRTILELFYLTGMRRAELIGLDDLSIDFERKIVKVIGKGKKERLIPLSAKFCNQIKAYVEKRNEAFKKDHFPSLFVTGKGNKMYPKFVYNIVKSYLSLVSTIEKRSPHILRHSFATHLSNKGAKLNIIKELLGHSNLSATQIYTHNSIEQLKKVYTNAHPKGK